MRLKPIVFFSVVALITGFLLYREHLRSQGLLDLGIGSKAPEFTLKDQNGRRVNLSDYQGKAVFLNFWATWCPPCIDEMPAMETLNEKFRDRKFQMLAVSVDVNWNAIQDFYKQYGLNIPTLLDPGRQVSSRYKVFKFPETYIIDRNGIIIHKKVGPERWADPQVLAWMDRLVREQEQE